MLPMRRLFSTLFMFVAVGLAGCKNQGTSTFTNPFLTPDRVPPPSTRVLAPGTAQPYYPGDPAPGAAPLIGAPAVGTPTYGPGATLPPNSAPLTTPPGGWGTYAPQSSSPPSAAPSGAPRDDQQLRFASSQSPAPQRLTPREVTPAEYMASPSLATGASLASAEAPGDGFRPQGSQPRTPTSESEYSFRPPEIRRDGIASTGQAETAHYAAAANHEWLRGQLEYWPTTGQWSVRYLPEGSPADQIGGRVMIENPQVLANLSPGELVMVQGQLFAKPTDAGAYSPAYRLAAVQRQRQ
jgi:hypothetical protein